MDWKHSIDIDNYEDIENAEIIYGLMNKKKPSLVQS